MPDAAIDNDVVLKSVSYGIFDAVLAAVPGGPHSYGVLGTARFVLPKALKKRPPVQLERAIADLAAALQSLDVLEPTRDEALLAAQLEYEALRQAKAMHPGECLLVAILLSRPLKHLLTGDRNAIAALGSMQLPVPLTATKLAGKFVCFEQAIRFLITNMSAVAVRAYICAEPGVDTALRLCFSCSAPEVDQSSWLEGLESQISHLRAASGTLLVA
ncbi:MAG: hypothetical protein LKM39_14505 [Chiayiivirga sp.]|jgi:hypothetical protein|nr:hypothetical protein [Chiayiivirga sp.]